MKQRNTLLKVVIKKRVIWSFSITPQVLIQYNYMKWLFTIEPMDALNKKCVKTLLFESDDSI